MNDLPVDQSEGPAEPAATAIPATWPPLPVPRQRAGAVRLPVEFRGFQELYSEPYHRLAHLQLGSRREAEETVGAVFHQLGLHWPHVMRQECPEAYGWAVLKHLLGQRRQALGMGSALVETATFEAVSLRAAQEQLEAMEGKLGLYAAIGRLPERQCDVIVLRYVLGYPDARTALIMGITEGSVRSNVRFAKRRLARELNIDTSADDGGE